MPRTWPSIPRQRLNTLALCPGLPAKTKDFHADLKAIHWLRVTHRIQYKLSLMMFLVHNHQCPDYMRTLCHWSVMILDVGDSVQLPVLTTTSRALVPNSETGRSRSLVRKRGTTYHNNRQLQAKT